MSKENDIEQMDGDSNSESISRKSYLWIWGILRFVQVSVSVPCQKILHLVSKHQPFDFRTEFRDFEIAPLDFQLSKFEGH